ncbi:TPA: DNA-binding protein, partial [Clostridioides difficile]|nr:DNA-binding protein [Clostridioides difficile]HBH4210720.1 DNA-binding protein [Clostridioides difficile]
YLNKKAKNIIKIYREELEEFKTKAFIPKRKKQQITQKDIDKIKKLSQDGLSYSKIQKITKWSKCTISKVINGYYDK